MTALYIFLAVLAFLLLLLFIPVRLSLVFRDDLSISLSYLFLHFPLYPKEKEVRLSDYTPRKLRKKKRKLKEKRKRKAAAAPPATAQQKKSEKPLEKRLRQLRLVISILKNVYKKILRAVHIRVKRLYVKIATDDAAKTALLYGAASGAVAHLIALFESLTKTTVARGGANVVADFCGTESTLDAHVVFSATPISLLCVGVRAAFLFLKHKLTKTDDKNKNGVNSHE